MPYSFLQIVDFFIIYCFIGWIWETLFVSLQHRKFVNRGFLHGPVIPIYGFGALAILFATMPFKDNLFLVFISGMVGASVLELGTGIAMEAIFGVRYWDYHNLPLNIKGYISLPSSIVWGLFSIVMVKVIHVPIEAKVLGMSQNGREILSTFLISAMSMDVALSVRAALDLKELLKHISEMERVARVSRKIEEVAKAFDNDKEIFTKKVEEIVANLGKGQTRRINYLLERNPSAVSMKYAGMVEAVKTNLSNAINKNRIAAKMEKIKNKREKDKKNKAEKTSD